MATNHYQSLAAATNKALIDGLPPGLKAAIDRLLARGASKPGVLSVVKAMIGKAGGDLQGLLGLAVEAYLESK